MDHGGAGLDDDDPRSAVLQRLAEHGLLQGERIGIDASTMEANAALRAIVRRDSGEGYRAMLALDVALLLLPLILVRQMSQTEFGLYKQAFLVAGTVVTIFPLGFAMSAFYFLPREAGDESHHQNPFLGMKTWFQRPYAAVFLALAFTPVVVPGTGTGWWASPPGPPGDRPAFSCPARGAGSSWL